MIQKTAEATVDLAGNKTANKITKVSKNSQQNNLETVTNENNKEIPTERYIYKDRYRYRKIDIYRYISLKERLKIIDNPRLIIKV